jgi:hypothetical protein
MTEDKNRSLGQYKGGVFQDLTNRIKLILRLLGDRRVSPLLKLIPIGSVLYLLFPDIAPGPIDDAAIIWLGAYLFVELCPPTVVEEHMAELYRTIPGQWRDPLQNQEAESDVGAAEEEIIEGEFREE